VVAPYETTPERWATLPWRFLGTNEPVPFGKPDGDGWTWRLGTIADMLHTFAGIHPHAMLDEAGAPCTDETRGPLKRMTIRDGKKFVTGKERLNWSDDPARAFETPDPEMWPAASGSLKHRDDPARDCDWPTVRAALAVVDAAAVARRLKCKARSVRNYRDGSRMPEQPREVAAAVVASAADRGCSCPVMKRSMTNSSAHCCPSGPAGYSSSCRLRSKSSETRADLPTSPMQTKFLSNVSGAGAISP
jgi:hypothetical protein